MKNNYTVTIDKKNDIITFMSDSCDPCCQTCTARIDEEFKLGVISYIVKKVKYTYKLKLITTGDEFRLYNNLQILVPVNRSRDMKIMGIRKAVNKLEEILTFNNIGFNQLRKVSGEVRMTDTYDFYYTDGIESRDGYNCTFKKFNWIISAKLYDKCCRVINIVVDDKIETNDKALETLTDKLSFIRHYRHSSYRHTQSDSFDLNKVYDLEKILRDKLNCSKLDLNDIVFYMDDNNFDDTLIPMSSIDDNTIVTDGIISHLKDGLFKINDVKFIIRYAKKLEDFDAVPEYKLHSIMINTDKLNTSVLYLIENELSRFKELSIYNKAVDIKFYTTC